MRSLFLAFFFLVTVSRCNYSEVKTPPTTGDASPKTLITDVQWLTTNLFKPKCASCHNGSRATAGWSLESESDVISASSRGGFAAGDAMAGAVSRSIMTGTMPPPRLNNAPSRQQVDVFECWIKNGVNASGNHCLIEFGITSSDAAPGPAPVPTPTATPTAAPTPPPTNTPGPEVVTFEILSRDVLKDNCVGCHSKDEPSDGVILEDKESILNSPFGAEIVVCGKPDESDLYTSVLTDYMPFDMPPISSDLKNTIKQWIEQGCQ